MGNIVLTGASRGIGFEALRELAGQGHNIWACVRTIKEDWRQLVKQWEDQNGIWIRPVLLDLEDMESIKNAALQIMRGGIA